MNQASTQPPFQHCIEPECGATFDLNDRLYVCSRCNGLLEIVKPNEDFEAMTLRRSWYERRASFSESDRSGVWRFRELLPFNNEAPIVSLEEGNTPLYDAPRAARYCGLASLKLKHQGLNPTGSFKDTGMTTAVTQARILGARLAVCASTGNTAASLAAYASRAEMNCAILVPQGQVSHAKLAQALDYGAKVLEIEGNFDDAMRVIRELAEDESVYLVNSINPFRIEGQKTVAAELLEQLDWQVPDHLVVPGGNLGNSSAFGKGLRDLFELGLIDRLPQITVVQAAGAAPFANLFVREQHFALAENATAGLTPLEHPQTLASAIKIGAPVSWKKALRAVQWTSGRALSVSEQEIADAKAVIGRDGIGCEPASATTVAGIRQLVSTEIIQPDQSVVAILTGHVLKDTDYVIRYHNGTLQNVDDRGRVQQIAGTFSNHPERVSATLESLRDAFARIQNETRG